MGSAVDELKKRPDYSHWNCTSKSSFEKTAEGKSMLNVFHEEWLRYISEKRKEIILLKLESISRITTKDDRKAYKSNPGNFWLLEMGKIFGEDGSHVLICPLLEHILES